jgi:CO/xanthine dehydrogenase Mo-binding subunit
MVMGQSAGRLEDLALVTGMGRFVADMSLPFQLHMRLARAPVAHVHLLAIDATGRSQGLIACRPTAASVTSG